jgi:SAM-dependent methyltransferase
VEFFDLVNISERYMELINPSTPEKLLRVGRVAGLNNKSRVLDMGCGFGEALALYGQEFGVSGIGVDIREYACQRATQKLNERGLGGRMQVFCANGAEYAFEKGAFDAAMCIGATFIWGSYAQTIHAIREAVRPGGKLIIGEGYWNSDQVPPGFAHEQNFPTEAAILRLTRQEGFEIEAVARASHDDWDRYESDNWIGLLRWIEENPAHPERAQVIDHLRARQHEYFTAGRKYLGWAIFLLTPAR